MVLLENGKFYHIYARGNNRTNLFNSNENYRYFLRLYEKYIDPIAETFAWSLMKNHFHLLVRIKEEAEVNLSQLPIPRHADVTSYTAALKKAHLYFSDLFNAYSQAINKKYGRTGALFERPFRRLLINSPEYFANVVVYIHLNPVHHGFTDDFKDYPWSSYGTILSLSSTKFPREKVVGWFNGVGGFIHQHNVIPDKELYEMYTIEEAL